MEIGKAGSALRYPSNKTRVQKKPTITEHKQKNQVNILDSELLATRRQ